MDKFLWLITLNFTEKAVKRSHKFSICTLQLILQRQKYLQRRHPRRFRENHLMLQHCL